MSEYTPEQLEVIRQRQRLCTHSFITSHRETRCVHCGVSRAEHEAMTPAIGWIP